MPATFRALNPSRGHGSLLPQRRRKNLLTQVDFYLLATDGALVRERLACRIAAKAFALGQRLHIHDGDEGSLARLDDLLWTFGDASFLPHARTGQDDKVAITLDSEQAPDPVPELLINLGPDIPAFFSRFPRVAEIVAGGAQARQLGRERYRFYRDRGYPLRHHEMRG